MATEVTRHIRKGTAYLPGTIRHGTTVEGSKLCSLETKSRNAIWEKGVHPFISTKGYHSSLAKQPFTGFRITLAFFSKIAGHLNVGDRDGTTSC